MVARLLADAGVTTILVTHDQSEALSFADQLAVMRNGRLVQSGHPMDLYRYPEDEETALFLGEAVVMPAQIEAGWAHCDLGRWRSTATASVAPRKSCCAPNNCRSPASCL
jgi:iron(III) transport system ATP-binding protein